MCKVCINIFEEDSMNICKNIVRGWKRGVTFSALFFTMFLPVCRQSLLSFLPFCYFYVARHVARTHDNSSFYRSTFKSSTRGWHVLNFCECYVGVSISSGTVFTRKPIINSSIILWVFPRSFWVFKPYLNCNILLVFFSRINCIVKYFF